ncbi:MAG: GTP cyclohydrolase II [Proteobacteria bacterium]|nr:GTP cyclohydrolase II [Pseudomonadota bacterium]
MAKQASSEVVAETRSPGTLLSVDRVIADLRRGEVAVIGAEGGASILVQAAEAVTPGSLRRLERLSGAPPALSLTRRRAATLGLSSIAAPITAPITAKVVTFELAPGIAAQTVRDIADPAAAIAIKPPRPLDVRSADLGACCSAAVELTKLARLLPAALTAPVDLKPGQDAKIWAGGENLLFVKATDIEAYQQSAARSLRPVSQARVPLTSAENARIVAYRPSDGGIEHLAIIIGEPRADAPVLTRLHSECFTGDLLASLRCDCGDQLRGAIDKIAEAGSGVLVYLAQEGRGIGLVNKLRAYRLQDDGFDTIGANEQLGFDADERVYLPAAEILRDLGYSQVRLLTNNPEKVAALARCGITVVERVPHVFPANAHNEAYLRTKATRGGHLF